LIRYPRVAQLPGLLAAPDARPLVLCEYAHSMGNSTGNAADYWAFFHAHPRAQGGFVWDWVDQALLVTDKYPHAYRGVNYLAYGGDFGDSPHDAQFCCNGLVWPNRTPHPALEEMRAAQAPLLTALECCAAGEVRAAVGRSARRARCQ